MKKLVLAAGLSSVLGVGALGVTQLPNLATAQNSGGATQASGDASALIEYEQNTINVVEQYGPSVVSVSITAQAPQQNPNVQVPEEFEDFLDQVPGLRDFLEQQQEQQGQQRQLPPQQGSGSGFVIDDAGRLITNYHVVQDTLQENSVNFTEGSSITVTFPGSEDEFPVRVVGVNTLYDFALLELQNPDDLPENVTPIPIADSEQVQVGQKAIAIGNPFGLDSTVSSGIVSAVSRFAPSIGLVEVPYVQTDAAINPGNSGGPLLNSQGEVIGINTFILSDQGGFVGTPGNIGIGFAVPSNLLQESLAQLEEGGFDSVQSRARLGLEGLFEVSMFPDEVRDNLNLPDEGVLFQEVQQGSAAEKAGLQGPQFEIMYQDQPIPAGGDVITAVDGEPVTTVGELQNAILSRGEGDTVTLTIVRDGQEQQVDVTLAQVPQQNQQNQQNQNQND